jgi:maltose O-acetyltransferase
MKRFIIKIIEEIDYMAKAIMHLLAMYLPEIHMKRFFYRLRGTKLGKHIDIAPMVFLEEAYPELITIKDYVDLGPGVIIVTHDSSPLCVSHRAIPNKEEVVIGRNVYIGAGAIILPGVKIGDRSIIGAGAVVTEDIPPDSVAVGVPAKVICTLEEWKKRKGLDL